jgi:hypothetical protein
MRLSKGMNRTRLVSLTHVQRSQSAIPVPRNVAIDTYQTGLSGGDVRTKPKPRYGRNGRDLTIES